MVKNCPKCGLANPDSAQRCDCGFDFESHRVEKSFANPSDKTNRAELGLTLSQVGKRNIRIGLIVFFVGIIASILISTFYKGVGIIIFISGSVIYGIIQFFRGFGQYRRGRRE